MAACATTGTLRLHRMRLLRCGLPQPDPADPAFSLRQDRTTRSQPGSRRSEEHTSELQSLMRISYAVFCLKKKKKNNIILRIQQPSYQDMTAQYKKQLI